MSLTKRAEKMRDEIQGMAWSVMVPGKVRVLVAEMAAMVVDMAKIVDQLDQERGKDGKQKVR